MGTEKYILPVTSVIIALILFFSILSIYNKKLFMVLLLHPYSIFRNQEYYRLITSDLVHISFPHLFINVAILYVFGTELESKLDSLSENGPLYMFIIHFSSMLFGNIYSSLKNRKDYGYSSAGASGSILGCTFSYIILAPDSQLLTVPFLGTVSNYWGVLLYILIMNYFRMKSKDDAVNHDLHFLGVLGGIAATAVLLPNEVLEFFN